MLAERGLDIVDLTVPGWTPTAHNVNLLVDEITKLNPSPQSIFIGDLISNVSFCFEQLTGTLALPIKSGGRFHMYGKVTVSSKDAINNVLEKLVPVFRSIPGLKICLPPLPRYLHNPCCTTQGHCEEIGTPSYAAELLSNTLGLRKILRDFLHTKISKIWVPDTVNDLLEKGGTVTEQAESLRYFFAEDGVHMSREGAKAFADIVQQLIDEQITASNIVSGREEKKEYFWRGFVSSVGSSRPSNMSSFHSNRTAGGGKWRGTDSGSGSSSGYSIGTRTLGRGGRSYPPAPSHGKRY